MAALLALCLTAALLPLPAHAAGGERTVNSGQELLDAINAATDGDIIKLGCDFVLGAENSGTEPWAINKSVTIQGNSHILTLWRGGIILGADVKFENIVLHFASSTRNAIIANGYTLTLDTVRANSTAHSFNLFCGGLIKNSYESFTPPKTGSDGQIIINGKTNLQGNPNVCGDGNIYAGNLCMGNMGGEGATDDSGPNQFEGNASITINADKDSNLGSIYACGAKQYAPAPGQPGKRTEPNDRDYTVTGTVTITGNNRLPDVEGGGSSATDVVYRGDGNPSESTFVGISSLSVETGNLALTASSQFENNGNLSVASGAKLDLTKADGRNLNVGNFSGNGGFLFLNQDQTLKITGQVTGTTKVAIGGTNYNDTLSSSSANVGQTYISAPNSTDSNFELLPHSSQPNMTLVRDSSGNWTASSNGPGGDINPKMDSISLGKNSEAVPNGTTKVILPLNVTPDDFWIEDVDLEIYVDGSLSRIGADSEGYHTYTSSGYDLFMTVDPEGNALFISGFTDTGAIVGGPYEIRIEVPAKNSSTGQKLKT
ncbi:MAG: hypothetical protein K2O93_02195, partial [Oscillospiraceae bacterium]|nr:hypothetical protein [Oscillospiraceae bacterium]